MQNQSDLNGRQSGLDTRLEIMASVISIVAALTALGAMIVLGLQGFHMLG